MERGGARGLGTWQFRLDVLRSAFGTANVLVHRLRVKADRKAIPWRTCPRRAGTDAKRPVSRRRRVAFAVAGFSAMSASAA